MDYSIIDKYIIQATGGSFENRGMSISAICGSACGRYEDHCFRGRDMRYEAGDDLWDLVKRRVKVLASRCVIIQTESSNEWHPAYRIATLKDRIIHDRKA